ncbi:Nucleotide exchange factor GrpE [[Mycoplasma] cavipharyngis]|uniref:nucleotide exchange factor GrpE n=1 Tax=[Mycoplasma] cavipharyngis TaxID=92757 RepID=UPI0037048910
MNTFQAKNKKHKFHRNSQNQHNSKMSEEISELKTKIHNLKTKLKAVELEQIQKLNNLNQTLEVPDDIDQWTNQQLKDKLIDLIHDNAKLKLANQEILDFQEETLARINQPEDFLSSNSSNDQDDHDHQATINKLKKELHFKEQEHKRILDEKISAIKNEYMQKSNDIFLAKIKEKAEQAEQVLNDKIAEYQAKFKSDLTYAKLYALEKHAKDLVTIINQFEAALSFNSEDPAIKNYLMGFNMFLDMFKQLLEDAKINKIIIEVGQVYDPEIMEAFETVECEPDDDNKVISIVASGYKLHDRVIKPVLVKVGSSKIKD